MLRPKPLWSEDEYSHYDPDRERIDVAFLRLTGDVYDSETVVDKFDDGGDYAMSLMPNGYVVYFGYDGYAIYPPGTPIHPAVGERDGRRDGNV